MGLRKKEPVFIENDLGKFKLVETKSVIYADGRKQPHIHRYYGGYAVWHGAESAVDVTVRCVRNANIALKARVINTIKERGQNK